MTASATTKTVRIENFIGGEYEHDSNGETFDTINPATGAVLGKVSLGGAGDINRAVKVAKDVFLEGTWSKKPLAERCQILKRIGDIIMERKEELARAETLDTGKPISETINGDIPRAAHNFHFFSDFAPSQGEECFTASSTERHITVRDPLGVCGLITPWNLPLYLATWKIAPCLAMGNSCVLKPAEWTPYTAYLLGEIANQAGLPKGVLNIVNGFGPGSAGEALTGHPDVKAISFTGETGTGRAIMSNAASTLKKLSFELGGKAANIIFADANLDEAIPTSVRAAFRNQGQICLAGSRLFVEESIAKQ
ncbi:MAG: aldehyde dehydrogenase family protein, partial [Cyanobacteria bacterium]|nr:aldehyde dehydrogenase family protein [Cyanobacteriota bacterium]